MGYERERILDSMGEITVQVQQPLVDFADGEVVTLEHTSFVDKLIDGGRVVPVTVETTTVQAYSGEVSAEIPVIVPELPAASASKAAWKAYADVHGVDTIGLTKQEIIEMVTGADGHEGEDFPEPDDAES